MNGNKTTNNGVQTAINLKKEKKMKIKDSVRQIWLFVGIISMILLAFHWFGFDSDRLTNAILIINGLALLLSLPCSLFAIPVLIVSNHYLELNPFSMEGIYLNTFLLFAIGFLQWFLIIRFWSPSEPVMQMLDLPDGHRN
jgi:hypothetical protein